ncbi:hypothetical protein AB3U99_01715 [Niallia sp. JL1B1071]|uniref:hypothetical protein n=1 Tax=Niallia tiangongensis TaxID=3237105 RepID=UPI0037DD7558
MNQYTIQFLCGQINYVRAFFENYQDDYITARIKVINKIKADLVVDTTLSPELAICYVEKTFQQSKYGCALHFNVSMK